MNRVAATVLIVSLSGNAAAAAKPPLSDESIPKTITLEAPADQFQKLTRTLPCPNGSFSTVITVLSPFQSAKFISGAVITLFGSDDTPGLMLVFGTIHHVLPLHVRIDEIGRTTKDVMISKLSPKSQPPGEAIRVDISWANSRSFIFVINGSERYAFELPAPVNKLSLEGVGSRSIFDKNLIQCDLIS